MHWVDENYDTGAVIAQVRVPVEGGDSPQSLAARVQAAERELVIEVLAAAASGSLKPPPLRSGRYFLTARLAAFFFFDGSFGRVLPKEPL